MKLLIDTHIFLWLNSEPEKLSQKILTTCENPENQLYLSLISPWEIQIKQQLGKLKLESPLSKLIETQVNENNLIILPIKIEHIIELNNLPYIHKDPFDRMLIAQAKIESMTIVTADNKIKDYNIETIS